MRELGSRNAGWESQRGLHKCKDKAELTDPHYHVPNILALLYDQDD